MSQGWITYGIRRRLPDMWELVNEVVLESHIKFMIERQLGDQLYYYYFKGMEVPHRSFSHNWGVPDA